MQIIGDSKLSRKFQITVPKDVRDLLRLCMGDRLVFVADKDLVLLKRGELQVQGPQPLKTKNRGETG